MSPTVKTSCDQAFHRFLRSHPHEIDPDSTLCLSLKIAFMYGYSEGGKEATRLVVNGIRKDIEELGK